MPSASSSLTSISLTLTHSDTKGQGHSRGKRGLVSTSDIPREMTMTCILRGKPKKPRKLCGERLKFKMILIENHLTSLIFLLFSSLVTRKYRYMIHLLVPAGKKGCLGDAGRTDRKATGSDRSHPSAGDVERAELRVSRQIAVVCLSGESWTHGHQ